VHVAEQDYENVSVAVGMEVNQLLEAVKETNVSVSARVF